MSVSRLDRESMLQRVGCDTDLLAPIIEVFIQSYPEQLASIHSLLESRDFNQVENVAHSLKGSIQMFFKGKIADYVFNLEVAAREQDYSKTSVALDLLNKEFEQIEPLLEELREYLC